jgi:hypothetical protein
MWAGIGLHSRIELLRGQIWATEGTPSRETEHWPFIGSLKRDREPSDPSVVSHAYIESQPG